MHCLCIMIVLTLIFLSIDMFFAKKKDTCLPEATIQYLIATITESYSNCPFIHYYECEFRTKLECCVYNKKLLKIVDLLKEGRQDGRIIVSIG